MRQTRTYTCTQPVLVLALSLHSCVQIDGGGEGAALPVDVAISVTDACQAGTPAGNSKSVAFSVTSTLNPQAITGVAVDLSFPTALLPTAFWGCVDASGTGECWAG